MKILIVEDNDVTAKLLFKTLSKYGNCDIACDGREAFSKYLTASRDGMPYDLLSIDINMPRWNGMQSIEAIREYELVFKKDFTKIIVISAALNSEIALELFNSGCCYCIKKPIVVKDIDEIIRNLKNYDTTKTSYDEMVLFDDELRS